MRRWRIGRGLFRLWLIGTTLWIAAFVWNGEFSCFVGSYPWCQWWVVSPLWQSTYLRVLMGAFGVPLAVLALGAALLWAARGFRAA